MIKFGVLSGRFDPPNSGHFMTIEQLLEEYSMLLIPILDYHGRTGCTADGAKAIFEHHFNMVIQPIFRNRINVIINTTHFAEITEGEYYELLKKNNFDYRFTTYLAGNQEVLEHMKEIGAQCEYVPRVTVEGIDQYTFESTKIRNRMNETGESLNEIYNITPKT